MCGLVGYLNASNEPASERLVQKMTAAIVHRGPDAEGSFVAKNLALGHRRLSIIDLSEAGTQPMTSSDGRFTIAYNGEVYNFKNIKRIETCRLQIQVRYRYRSSSQRFFLLGNKLLR